jgi:desampylase
MIEALAISKDLREQIAEQARRAYPNECCGLIEGSREFENVRAIAIHPTRNVADGPDRFEIDPAEHIRLLRAAREAGNTIIGCYHSHPNGSAGPSAADKANASDEDFVWVIAAVGPDEKPRLASFVYTGGGFAPIRLARAKAAKV